MQTRYKINSHLLMILLVSASFNFCSCLKKDTPQTTVHGKVSNRLTGEGVKNIPIEIIECDERGKCLYTITTGYTDLNGNYKISFLPNKRKSYSVAVGVNNIIGNTPYPYYPKISKYIDNKVDFDQLPLTTLLLHVLVKRHDKNFLQVQVYGDDSFGYYSNNLYTGLNPSSDMDSTYQITLEAGRKYKASIILSNKTAAYTYIDPEFLYKQFSVKYIDTTRVLYVVQ